MIITSVLKTTQALSDFLNNNSADRKRRKTYNQHIKRAYALNTKLQYICVFSNKHFNHINSKTNFLIKQFLISYFN